MLKVTAMLGASILLGACATQSVDPNYRINTQSTEGVVIGSVSYAGRFSGYSVHYRNMTTGETGRFQIGQSQAIFPVAPKSDFDDKEITGTVFAVQLPPGEYLASRWSIGSGAANVSSTIPFSIHFKVEPGKMVYMGSFQFTQTSGMGLTVTGATLAYKDEAERDLAVMRKKFPNLATVPIAYAVAPGTSQQNVGGTSSLNITLPVYIPIVRR